MTLKNSSISNGGCWIKLKPLDPASDVNYAGHTYSEFGNEICSVIFTTNKTDTERSKCLSSEFIAFPN
jgi:hypothetical protein